MHVHRHFSRTKLNFLKVYSALVRTIWIWTSCLQVKLMLYAVPYMYVLYMQHSTNNY